jgi:glycosyltransferase involved in cell wall biosynthesis
VRFTGWRSDIPRILAALHVFVLPSRYEGHSMALLEAMASARACIVSDIPELAAVIGDAGERVRPADPQALAAAIARLVGDAGRRTVLGRRAFEIAQRYSVDVSAARYAELYEEVLNHAGGRGRAR